MLQITLPLHTADALMASNDYRSFRIAMLKAILADLEMQHLHGRISNVGTPLPVGVGGHSAADVAAITASNAQAAQTDLENRIQAIQASLAKLGG